MMSRSRRWRLPKTVIRGEGVGKTENVAVAPEIGEQNSARRNARQIQRVEKRARARMLTTEARGFRMKTIAFRDVRQKVGQSAMSSNVPTLRSLAAALGLSRTTVSDALRGSPRVDPATAVRVRKAARDAGYRRNPLAGALMSELRRSRGTTFRGVLAAVDLNEPDLPVSNRSHRELVLGAEA